MDLWKSPYCIINTVVHFEEERMEDEKEDLVQRIRNAEQYSFEFLQEAPQPQPHKAPAVDYAMDTICIHNCNACPNCDNN